MSSGIEQDLLERSEEVTEINEIGKRLTIATIDWGDDEIPPRVNVNNLKRITDWEPN